MLHPPGIALPGIASNMMLIWCLVMHTGPPDTAGHLTRRTGKH